VQQAFDARPGAANARGMTPRQSQNWSRFSTFLRTPSLVRSVSGLLILAFVLLLTVNMAELTELLARARIGDPGIEHIFDY